MEATKLRYIEAPHLGRSEIPGFVLHMRGALGTFAPLMHVQHRSYGRICSKVLPSPGDEESPDRRNGNIKFLNKQRGRGEKTVQEECK